MTREQIEQAIRRGWIEHHIGNQVQTDEDVDGFNLLPSENFREGFIAGAEWRINSVWHDASEEPNLRDMVVVLNSAKDEIYDFGFWGVGDKIREGHTWARMKDLIPIPKGKKGGAE